MQWLRRRQTKVESAAIQLTSDELTVERLTLSVLGIAHQCWRCQAWGTIIVGIGYSEMQHGVELASCDDEFVLEVAIRHLGPEVLAQHRIGEIKPRFSKTAGRAYLSNGCHHCDALFGNFLIYHEELVEILDNERASALIELASLELSTEFWNELFERSPFGAYW